MKFSLLLTAALTAIAPLGAADWTQFRGPNGDGLSGETGVPVRMEPSSLTWSIALPGRGLSSPLILGDKVFVTAGSGARQDRLHVLCFRVTDGSLLWERQFWATGRTMTHEKIGAATPTPASDGKAIYAIFSSNDCVALDLDGRLLWFRGLGRDYPNASNSLGMSSSLVVVDGVVVAMVENDSESFTAGLDARTGVNRWKLDRPKKANWTSPVVFKSPGQPNRVLLQSAQGVTAVDPTTGKIAWDITEGASTVPSLVVSQGRLVIPANGITVVEPGAGDAKPKSIWRSAQLRPGTASPVVVGGRLLTLNDGGILTCADAQDGKRLWQLRLKGSFSATPVVAGGHLYCVSEEGRVQVVDPSKAEGIVVSELALEQTVIGTPSIAAGSLFVRSDSRLVRLGGTALR
ncbi:MAG: hypothetical protein RIS56_1551 [Verrucomicrobiota bacterium]|jgi:outer membrane protein assembly factor BamB